MDRYLTVLSLKPKDGSTADAAVQAACIQLKLRVPTIEVLSRQDYNVKDLTKIYKGPEVLMNSPGLGRALEHARGNFIPWHVSEDLFQDGVGYPRPPRQIVRSGVLAQHCVAFDTNRAGIASWKCIARAKCYAAERGDELE